MADEVEEYRAALQSCPPGHSNRSTSLDNLATCLRDRFQQRGVLSDLDEAIELHRAALLLCPPGHSDRLLSLNNLAICLRDVFQQRGVPSDLDEAIELHQAAFLLCPPGHSERPRSLNNIATCLTDRFEQRGVLSDLDEAIELHRAALLLRPPGHSDRSRSLSNLAACLRDRFRQRGVPSDFDEAIELHRAALLLRPPGHSDRSLSLSNLATCLNDRFKQRGVPSDLDEAIELHRAALLLRPPGHSGRSLSLNNLATYHRKRFEQRGVPSDLDEAIELHRAALLLRPPGHSERSASLNNVAACLRDRFLQRGVPSDLDEAIELHRAALLLRPPGHSNRSTSLNNLGGCLVGRFKQRGIPSDLDEAIELNRAALLLRPPGHSERSTSLDNVATCLRDRFQQRGVASDLDEAIELHRAALLLYPRGHSSQSTSLNNLGGCYRQRFEQRGIPSDLDEAIEFHRAALLLRPPGHSNRSTSLKILAGCLADRFKHRGVLSDLDEAFKMFVQLSHISHAASRGDLSAAKSWVTSAEETKNDSALLAYHTALKFLDQHVTLLSSSSRHFDAIREATSFLATDAFSCSVRHGALTTAVELVEQGRAVFWTQMSRFRSPLVELSLSGDSGAALAEEFKRLSFRLRDVFDQSTEDQSPHIRHVTLQWDDVVSRIRMIPDFSRFLLPPLFSDLQKAAEEGPVIIVNASEYSCDALIITNTEDPVHVPLDITRAKVSELSSEFQSLAEQLGSSNHQLKLVGILRKLWNSVVDPVVQALRESGVCPRSRIWWCPTAEFTLLPLHAAGQYEKNKEDLSRIYISSYTPTLAALIRARQQLSRDTSTQHFVAIGQANPERGKELRCVAPELAVVAQRLAPVAALTSLEGSDATVQGAIDALSQNQWLHLACHGMPNREDPFESSFAMRDGPLMIRISSDPTGRTRSSHSCRPVTLPVIGSMWSVDDEVARQVASAFYDHLVDDSGRLDCTRAAVALRKAVKSLRKLKIPLEQQIVFVHIGV
ncbi:TPR-like protein [Suillus lakei]|nr:TPR-like protein [Suillus lakei]